MSGGGAGVIAGINVGDRVEIAAPAKVNLWLHVVGRRPDGYHLLDSLVVFPETGDRITVEATDELALEVTGPFAADVPAGPENLVLRAARALAATAGRPVGAAIGLEKRLPVAAGIGGGSADAAATLRALCRLWRLRPDPAALQSLALRLGADVPMCLARRPVHVGGIGEEVEPAPALPSFALVLVNPRVPLPTPPVFAGRSGPFSAPAPLEAPPGDVAAFASLLAMRRNDLTDAAIALVPEVTEVLGALAATPGVRLARMSGSGATCFGLCDDAGTAVAAAASIAARRPDWWTSAAPVATAAAND